MQSNNIEINLMPSSLVVCNTFRDIQWLNFSEHSVSRDINIFRIKVSQFASSMHHIHSLLNSDEILRMNRYRLEADQQRFSIARSILRVLLGRQVDLNPIDIHFTDSFNKKPRLKDFAHVHHSVSHSGDWIVIAIAGSPVGIDVEKVDSNFFFPDVVAHSFSQAEKEYIENNDSPRTRFYQLWTRKEALAKAKGHGIDDNFYRIPSIDGTHNVEKEPPYFTENWAISGFNVAGEYLAAIAYRLETTRQAIHFFNVDPDLLSSQSV